MNRKRIMVLLLACTMIIPTAGTRVLAQEASDAGYELTSQAEDNATYEELKASFTLTIETEGKTSADLLAEGTKYELGDGVTQFYSKAMAYYEAALSAAAPGSDDETAAQHAIEALNTFKDEKLAEGVQGWIFTFYRTGVTASQQGNYELSYNVCYDDAFFFEEPENRGIGGLGDLLRDGTGIEQDIDKAIAVYTYCAEELGKGNAYTALGLMYQASTGTYPGVTQNLDQAMACFLLSFDSSVCESTDFKGPRYAANMLDTGYVSEKDGVIAPNYILAEKYYLVAVAGNGRTFDGTAAYQLGTYYEQGRTCNAGTIAADMEKAVEYYLKALSDSNVHSTMLGIPQCYLTLGKCYENGNGVTADIATAVSYYQKAYDAAIENLELANTSADNSEMELVRDTAKAALDRITAAGTANTAPGTTDSTSNTSAETAPETAPKTGETNNIWYLLAALLSCLGICTIKMKKNTSN